MEAQQSFASAGESNKVRRVEVWTLPGAVSCNIARIRFTMNDGSVKTFSQFFHSLSRTNLVLQAETIRSNTTNILEFFPYVYFNCNW